MKLQILHTTTEHLGHNDRRVVQIAEDFDPKETIEGLCERLLTRPTLVGQDTAIWGDHLEIRIVQNTFMPAPTITPQKSGRGDDSEFVIRFTTKTDPGNVCEIHAVDRRDLARQLAKLDDCGATHVEVYKGVKDNWAEAINPNE